MDKQSVKIDKSNNNYNLFLNNRIILTSPHKICEVAPDSSNYLIFDNHGNFKIYNVKRCTYVSNRTFTEIAGYSIKSKSFAAKICINSNLGIYYSYLLILESGYIFEGKHGPEFFKQIRLEFGGIRSVQMFNADDAKCYWSYLNVSIDKAEFLWKNKATLRLPLGDIVSFQQTNFHAFYFTIADIKYIKDNESSEPRKFLYYYKFISKRKAYDNEVVKVIDKRASFNNFTVCNEAPLYFIGEQILKGGSRHRLFRFNYKEYNSDSDKIRNKFIIPTKQMLIPVTDFEYYDKIEYIPSEDIFAVSQENRWFLLQYDKNSADFNRPLKSISYPSNTFTWINDLFLAIRDDGFYDIFHINGSKYQCISFLWRNVTYNNKLSAITFNDLNGVERIVPLSLILDMHSETIRNSPYSIDFYDHKHPEHESITHLNTLPKQFHIDYCTLTRLNYQPADFYLSCEVSTNGISLFKGKTFCVVSMNNAIMYICEFVRKSSYIVLHTIKLNPHNIKGVAPCNKFIIVDKTIKTDCIEQEIIELIKNNKQDIKEIETNPASVPNGFTLNEVDENNMANNKETQMDPTSSINMYQKIILTIDLWKSIIPIDVIRDFIRPIIHKFHNEITPKDKDLASLFEIYGKLIESPIQSLDESIMPALEQEVAADTMAHFKIALNYHHKLKHHPFNKAFNISLQDIECGSFIERAMEKIVEEKRAEIEEKIFKLEETILNHLLKHEVKSITLNKQYTDTKSNTPLKSVSDKIKFTKPIKERMNLIVNNKHYSCSLNDIFSSTINERQRRVLKSGDQVMIFVNPSEVNHTEKTNDGVCYKIVGEGKNPRESQFFGSNGNGYIRSAKDYIYLFVQENTGKYRLHDIVQYISYSEAMEGQRSVIYFKLRSCAKH